MAHPALAIGVLGPLEVRRDGVPVAVPAGRRRTVLGLLLCDAGRDVSAEVLVEAAWADRRPANAAGAVHTVVSRLRSLLGTDAVPAGAGGYRLAVPPDAVDAHRFEAMLHEARKAPPAVALERLDAALALWRGRPYADLEDCVPLRDEAARLAMLRVDAREEHALLVADLRDLAEAAAELTEVVAADPYRERAVVLLGSTLQRAGRPAEASRVLQDYGERLGAGTGLRPGRAVVELEQRLRDGAGAEPGAGRPQLDPGTAFLGRSAELAALTSLVGQHRVVTVTGTAGVGKTRLVAESLPGLTVQLGCPVTVVDLTPTRTAEEVPAQVARAFGIHRRTGDLVDAVAEQVWTRALLLVLDGCENHAGTSADLVERLTRSCPGLRVVTTGRRRLGLALEHVLPVAPLPPPGSPVDGDAAVDLLMDVVARARPGWQPSAADRRHAAQVCRSLDGLPFAIELAGARAAGVGLAPVAARLVAVDPLAGDPAIVGPVTRMLDWSVRQLRPETQRLLAWLAVLAAGFSAGDVEQLCASRGAPDPDLLGELLDASLAVGSQGERDRVDGSRLRLPGLVRGFAVRQLEQIGEDAAARDAHLAWVAGAVTRAADLACGPDGGNAYRWLSAHRDDLAAATRRAMETARPTVAAQLTADVRLCLHWDPGPALAEVMAAVGSWLRAEHAGSPGESAATAAEAFTLAENGDLARAVSLARSVLGDRARAGAEPLHHEARSLALMAGGIATLYAGDQVGSEAWWRELRDLPGAPVSRRAEGHVALALLAAFRGDRAAARERADVAVLAAATSRAPAVRAWAHGALAEVTMLDDPERALSLLAETVTLAEEAEADQAGRMARLSQLVCLVRTDRDREAVGLLPGLINEFRALGSWPPLWGTLRWTAVLAARHDRPHEAAYLLAAASAAESGPEPDSADERRFTELEAALGIRLGEPAVEQVRELGWASSRGQVLDRAGALVRWLSSAVA